MPFDGRDYENDTVRLLSRATEILEKGWCVNTRGMTPDFLRVSPHDPRANRFCALGALDRAASEMQLIMEGGVDFMPRLWGPISAAFGGLSNQQLADWNNSTDQATVVAGFKKAIDRAREKALAPAA